MLKELPQRVTGGARQDECHSSKNLRASEDLGETQEEPGQESPYSAQNLHAKGAKAPGIPQHQGWVKWPPASKVSEWQKFNDDLDGILKKKRGFTNP